MGQAAFVNQPPAQTAHGTRSAVDMVEVKLNYVFSPSENQSPGATFSQTGAGEREASASQTELIWTLCKRPFASAFVEKLDIQNQAISPAYGLAEDILNIIAEDILTIIAFSEQSFLCYIKAHIKNEMIVSVVGYS